MRFHRPLSMAVAMLLPFGLVAMFTGDPDHISAASTASPTTAVEPAESSDTEAAWLVTHAERVRIQKNLEAARVAAEAEAARVAKAEAEAAAEAARVAEADRVAKRRQTTTTVSRRYTATTVASTPAEGSPARATGSLPPKYVSDCESGGNPRAVNPNGHYGKWQFSQSTWESVGGTGRPDQASEAEQDYRASLLWDDGDGAGHWECY